MSFQDACNPRCRGLIVLAAWTLLCLSCSHRNDADVVNAAICGAGTTTDTGCAANEPRSPSIEPSESSLYAAEREALARQLTSLTEAFPELHDHQTQVEDQRQRQGAGYRPPGVPPVTHTGSWWSCSFPEVEQVPLPKSPFPGMSNGWDELLGISQDYERLAETHAAIQFIQDGLPAVRAGMPFNPDTMTARQRELLSEGLEALKPIAERMKTLKHPSVFAPKGDYLDDEYRRTWEVMRLLRTIANCAHAHHVLGKRADSLRLSLMCYQLALKAHGGTNLAGCMLAVVSRTAPWEALLRASEDRTPSTREIIEQAIHSFEKGRVEVTSRRFMLGEAAFFVLHGHQRPVVSQPIVALARVTCRTSLK